MVGHLQDPLEGGVHRDPAALHVAVHQYLVHITPREVVNRTRVLHHRHLEPGCRPMYEHVHNYYICTYVYMYVCKKKPVMIVIHEYKNK